MRCKIGDLAITVKAVHQRDVGKLVKVVRSWSPGNTVNGWQFNDDSGCDWEVESVGSPFVGSYGVKFQSTPCPDHCLRPIRPDAETDTRDVTIKLKEPA